MSSASLRFDGRVAIVTGSGRGLGREYALLLGRLGAAVVVNSTTPATAEATAKDIIDAGGKAIAHVGNVADRELANALVKTAVDKFGRIDIVINNAGGANAYGAAKLGLLGLAKSLAIEGKEHNIFVNTVAPMGFTPGSAASVQDEQTQHFMKEHMPARDVAPTVAWLVHEGSKVNGEAVAAVSRLVTRIFLAETKGFFGSADKYWTIETVRNNWDKVVDGKDYSVHTDIAEFGPKIFQRLATGQ
ncbi:hypothetical protein Aspvir_009321 [Aspergillus viridinutans]|uniref:Uncharacterized protein n=1 Tax=Aspergillus viridinutans TaxID=75553 RepID=A0A9P3F4G2_ASPVI|nr:uncharacterized protein Aspvir_009321 [Aspergillus viridinutans]GIK05217.1 hypothetical protein Aspvir_009321 [Aspergillus viridinutans]